MKLSAQLRSTHDQDGAIVLDILHGEMFRLNFVGSRSCAGLELRRQLCSAVYFEDSLSLRRASQRGSASS